MERHYQFKGVFDENSTFFSLITKEDGTTYVERSGSSEDGLFEFGSLVEAYEFILEGVRQ